MCFHVSGEDYISRYFMLEVLLDNKNWRGGKNIENKNWWQNN